MADDRAFDRYGRILGSTGLTPIVNQLDAGFSTREVFESIKRSNPNASDSEIMEVITNADTARQKSTPFQQNFEAYAGYTLADVMALGRTGRIDKATLTENPALFGDDPAGQRYRFGGIVFFPDTGVRRPIYQDYPRMPGLGVLLEDILREAGRRAGKYPGEFVPAGTDVSQAVIDEIFSGEYRF